MGTVDRFRKQLENTISKALQDSPKGGSFLIAGNPKNNKLIIDAANSIPGVEGEECDSNNYSGKVVKITVEPLPELEISYDGGKSWAKA